MTEYGFSFPITVRLNDIDTNEHVNNTAFVTYLQEARVNYFREMWGDAWEEASVVVATMTVDFLAPIALEDEVVVDVFVTEVGTTSWTVEYVVRAVGPDAAERTAGEGSSVQVAWDRENETSRPLPDAWKETLEDELVPTDR